VTPAPDPAPIAGAALPFEGLGAGLAQGLAAALEDGEDEVARELLARLEPLALSAADRASLDSCRRVLAGRELVQSLHIALVPVPGAEPSSEPDRLYLEILQSTDAPLALRLPPADLEHLRTWITPEGIVSRTLAVRPIAGLERLLLPPGVARRLELGVLGGGIPGALAVRDTFEVAFRSGEVERAGERLPVRAPAVPHYERTTVAPELLGAGAVQDPPGELARALGDAQRPLAELLALAVCVPDAAREAALETLTPQVERLAHETPERLQLAAPALRWLTRAEEPGVDPARWAAWFRSHAARRAAQSARVGLDPRLDLPVAPR
jgi:hypothetical protein